MPSNVQLIYTRPNNVIDTLRIGTPNENASMHHMNLLRRALVTYSFRYYRTKKCQELRGITSLMRDR